MIPAIDTKPLHNTLRQCIETPSPQPDMDMVRQFIRETVQPHAKRLPVDRLQLDGMGNLVAVLNGMGRAHPSSSAPTQVHTPQRT